MSNISFGYGIHRTPTLGNDGELSECVNLIPENGELVNIQPPKKMVIQVDKDTETLVAVHETSSFKHYIVKVVSEGTTSLAYFSEGETERKEIECDYVDGFKRIECIGNTLVVITDSGICYHLWKNESYLKLGQKPPFLDMSFGLSPNYDDENAMLTNEVNIKDYVTKIGYYNNGPGVGSVGIPSVFAWTDIVSSGSTVTQKDSNETLVDKISTVLTGLVDEARNQQEQNDRFTDSFFVRYAYRTYNGSMMVSPPILMTPTYGDQIIAIYPNYDSGLDGSNVFKFTASTMAYGFDLFYQLNNATDIKGKLADWSDIISGVDIFVSRQITRYKSSGKFRGAAYYGYKPWESTATTARTYTPAGLKDPEIYDYQYGIGKTTSCITKSISTIKCAEYTARKHGYGESANFWVATGFRKKDSEFFEELEQNGIFYRYKFIETKELAMSAKIEPSAGTLSSIESRETLTDGLYSNDTLIPELSFIYNRRLNIADITNLLHAFKTPSLIQYTNTTAEWEYDEEQRDYVLTEISGAEQYDYDLYLSIQENGTTVVVHNTAGLQLHESPHYLYYPNSHVTTGILVRTNISTQEKKYAELVFEQHKTLSGSYWFDEFDGITYQDTATIPTGSDRITYHNMIFVSEVNNPFVFNTTNMASVGQGQILGISTANKALSGGTEFGANPLLCFCSDGIWPMSVSSDGTYATVKPLTRDVVTNPDNILQLDNAVAFVTKRGLMVTDGSETGTVVISDVMHGQNMDESMLKGLISSYDSIIISDTEDFVTMVQSCKMVFDYSNQLIHIYPSTAIGKHFVYSIKAKEFSSYAGTDSDIITSVPGYPLSTIQLTDGYLAQYESPADFTTMRKGVLMTRPIAFDSPFVYKVIEDLKMSYSRNSSTSKCYIQPYVSNDRYNWFKMTSLRSHSYKWFRFAIFTNLCDIDGLEGLTVQEEVVRNNKIR